MIASQESAIAFLPFVEALAQGRVVTKLDGNGQFKRHSEYAFDGDPKDYRIEPDEPYPEVQTAGQVAKHAFGICQGSMDESWEAAAFAAITHHEAAKPRVEKDDVGQEIIERDEAEEAMSQAYYLVTGRSPEWSNIFGYTEALEEISDAVALLKAVAKPTVSIVPTAAEVFAEWRDLVPGVSRIEMGDEASTDGTDWRPLAENVVGDILNPNLKGRRRVAAQKATPMNDEWYRKNVGACPDLPEWTPPVAPKGREWHKSIKECWDDGKRALLVGEILKHNELEGYFPDRNTKWIKQEGGIGLVKITEDFDIYRTSLPLPAASELVALEAKDIHPGDRFRRIGDTYVGPHDISLFHALLNGSLYPFNLTYKGLMSDWELCPWGDDEWVSCSKPKTS